MGGGGKGGSAPKAPNYAKLMKQQNVLNKDANLYNARLGNADIDGIGGSVRWTDDGTGKFTGNLSLDPSSQAMWDKSGALANSGLDYLSNLGEWNPSQTPEYDPNSGRMHADALYERTMSRLRPEQDRERSLAYTQMNQRGLHPGSQAYDYQNESMIRSQNDAAERAAFDAEIAGDQTARANYATALAGQGQQYNQEVSNRKMPWDEFSAAQNAQNSVAMPKLPGFSAPSGYTPGNLTQAAQATYENKMGQQSSQNGKKNSMLNAGAMIGGSMMGGGGGGGFNIGSANPNMFAF